MWKKGSGNSTLYYCAKRLDITNKETCYESIDTNEQYNSVVREDDAQFTFDDGACCENLRSLSPVCCIVQLNKAIAIK